MLSKQSESATALFSQVFYLKTAYYKDHRMGRETTSAGGSAIIHSRLNWLRILNTQNLGNKSRNTALFSCIAGMGGSKSNAPCWPFSTVRKQRQMSCVLLRVSTDVIMTSSPVILWWNCLFAFRAEVFHFKVMRLSILKGCEAVARLLGC